MFEQAKSKLLLVGGIRVESICDWVAIGGNSYYSAVCFLTLYVPFYQSLIYDPVIAHFQQCFPGAFMHTLKEMGIVPAQLN